MTSCNIPTHQMAYQEHAQLGPDARRKAAGGADGRPTGRESSDAVDRPYNHRATASFSVPRPSPPHSSSSSTSSATLSPSNSVSQQDAASPTAERTTTTGLERGGGGGPKQQPSVSLLKELELGAAAEKRAALVEVDLPWRPGYLRRRILAVSLLLFASLIVALEVLGDISNRNAGLLDGNTARRTIYAWTYLPILGLTILAAVWTRVDHQAKAAAPWIRMAKGPSPAERTLLMDYIDMSLPVSIVKAVLNRDVVVACTAIVSLHLGMLVVLSTALLTLSLVDVPELNTRVTLKTAFVDDPAGLARIGSLPFSAMVGLLQDNTSLPDGVTSRFAFQRFSADVPFGTEIHATVDGFSAGLDCEPAQLTLHGAQYRKSDILLNTTVSVPDGCSIDMPIVSEMFLANFTVMFSRFSHGGCGDSNDSDDQRIVVIFGSETVNATSLAAAQDPQSSISEVNVTLSRSAQLICKPTYALRRLDVRKDDWSPAEVDLADTNTRMLSNVRPWDIAQAVFDSYQGALASNFSDTSPPFYQGGNLTIDPAMYLALGLQRASTGSPVPLATLFDNTTLHRVGEDYYQQYTALISSRALMKESSSSTRGTVSLSGERLLVRPVTVQLMVYLLGISFTLTAMAICFVPRKGFLPRDPNTIIDTAALIAHSRPLLQSLRGAGGASNKLLRERLRGTKYSIGVEAYEHGSSSDPGYFKIFGGSSSATQTNPGRVGETEKYSHPINLHPAVQLASLVGLLAIIILLELSLRTSQKNPGFPLLGDDEFSHFLWTAMPALILSHFATYFASVDFTTRALAPYATLKDGGAFDRSVSLNYLNKAVPRCIYAAARHRNIGVVTTGLTVLVSSLLVMLSAPLFVEETFPETDTRQLLSRDFFLSNSSSPSSEGCLSCRNGIVVSSLILSNNLSYPAYTYEDLVFPAVERSDNDFNSSEAVAEAPARFAKDVTVTAALPAIRPTLSCVMLAQDSLTPILTPEFVSFRDETNHTLTINMTKLEGTMAFVPTIDANPSFGASSRELLDLGNGTVISHWFYVWGQLSQAGTNETSIQTVTAMACNESIQQVTALTTMNGFSSAVDPSSPPVVDASTVLPLTLDLADNWDYSFLSSFPTTHLLDPFFSTLTSSRYAIPVSTLSDTSSSAIDHVASAIKFHHSIIRSQVLNVAFRQPLNLSSVPVPFSPTANLTTPSRLSFNSTATTFTVPSPRDLTVITRRASSPPPPAPPPSKPDDPSNFTDPLTQATPLSLPATRRIVQSPTSTRILQSILSLTLLLSLTSLLLLSRPCHPRPSSPSSIASISALLADGNVFGLLGRNAEWVSREDLKGSFMDGLHVAMRFGMGWVETRARRRRGGGGGEAGGGKRVFGVSAIRTGGWGGGEGVGLGGLARVGLGQRRFVGDWGWRT